MCNCSENTTPCPDNSVSKISVKWSEILDKPLCFTPCLDDLNFVLESRTLTINGETFDLSANRSWTINTGSSTLAGLSDVTLTGLTAGNVLYYNGTNWINQTVDGSKWISTGPDIYRNSNVAIGTNTISGKLHVAGNIHVSGGNVNIFNTSNNYLALGTNNLERIRIENNGVVGMGINYSYTTSSTTNRLILGSNSVVGDDFNYDLLRIITSPISTVPSKYVGINFEVSSISSQFGLAAIRAFDVGSNRGDLTFFTDNGTANFSFVERMRITYDGKVGIGTTTPSTELHVIGATTISTNLTVGGNTTITGNLSVTGGSTLNKYFNLIPNNNTTLDANYVVADNDNILYFNATLGRNLTLPNPTTNVGRTLFVYNSGSAAVTPSTPAGSIIGTSSIAGGTGKVFICFTTGIWLALTTT